jgi:hypothetical protein
MAETVTAEVVAANDYAIEGYKKTDVIESPADRVYLDAATTKGLTPASEKHIKNETVKANNYLNTAGVSLRNVAYHLWNIKQELFSANKEKSRGWNAYLDSGALHCSKRFAQDLVGAHESWLGEYDGDNYLLAGLSPRSLSAMGAEGVTDKDRQKVFDEIQGNLSKVGKYKALSEANIRFLTSGQVKKASKKGSASAPKEGDELIKDLKARLEAKNKENYDLKKQIKKLRTMIADLNKMDGK